METNTEDNPDVEISNDIKNKCYNYASGNNKKMLRTNWRISSGKRNYEKEQNSNSRTFNIIFKKQNSLDQIHSQLEKNR